LNPNLLSLVKSRISDNWLIGYDSQRFYDLVVSVTEYLQDKQGLRLLIAHSDPWEFLAVVVGALSAVGIATNTPVFLGSPHWVASDWQQVYDLVKPNVIWGNAVKIGISPTATTVIPQLSQPFHQLPQANSSPSLPPQAIMIPTGGTSGQIRFTIHTWATLQASVQGVYKFFGENPINSFCTLPLYHVSGLMQFLRSLLTNGKIIILSYATLKQGNTGNIDPAQFFISLVPTQLQHLLTTQPQWLAKFQTILLGGAPATKTLLYTARKHRLRLAPTYGMTETASQVVTLHPDDFLQGYNSSGQVLPHATVRIQNEKGESIPNQQVGIVTIQATSLCLGYYRDRVKTAPLSQGRREGLKKHQIFITDDLGYFDSQGLHIVGRNSQKIITGGENVFPQEIESVILSTGLVEDICVVGIPDSVWGEAIVAVYVSEIPPEEIANAVATQLSPYKCPKHWIKLSTIPHNPQGKINYQNLRTIIQQTLRS
jgi:O-succinylbenzoic acid--CoA ligase